MAPYSETMADAGLLSPPQKTLPTLSSEACDSWAAYFKPSFAQTWAGASPFESTLQAPDQPTGVAREQWYADISLTPEDSLILTIMQHPASGLLRVLGMVVIQSHSLGPIRAVEQCFTCNVLSSVLFFVCIFYVYYH